MKYILVLTFSVFILVVPSKSLETCNITTAQIAVNPIIFFEQTIDGANQNVLYTRFLHNKVGILASELGKCYLNYFNPSIIYLSTGLYGLLFYLYFLYKVFTNKTLIIFSVILLIPFLSLFILSAEVSSIYFKLTAILGVAIYFRKK